MPLRAEPSNQGAEGVPYKLFAVARVTPLFLRGLELFLVVLSLRDVNPRWNRKLRCANKIANALRRSSDISTHHERLAA